MPQSLPHIAILDEELPFPLNSGKRIRTYNLLSRLCQRYRFTYICYRNANEQEQNQAEDAIGRLGIKAIVIDRIVPPKKGIAFYIRLLKNLCSTLPYSVQSHASKELLQSSLQLLREDPPDLWLCEWTPYAQTIRLLLERHKTLRWMIMAHNVESQIWARFASNEKNPLKRWFLNHQFLKYQKFEKWACTQSLGTIAVSRSDAKIFKKELCASTVELVENGVDTTLYTPGERPQTDQRLLFLGSLDWRPNLDGITFLLNQVMPGVWSQNPGVKLEIVGRRPPAWLTNQIDKLANVQLYPDVPDALPFIQRASLMVVPLRIGGGSRLKILEALACRLPVISTTIGAEGLDLENNIHVTIADEPHLFASKIIELLESTEVAATTANNGYLTIKQNYCWNKLALQLDSIWKKYLPDNLSRQSDYLPLSSKSILIETV